jgi:diguanylate cyclase (GGDEF)-like protein
VQGVITLSKLQTNQFDENSVRLLEIVAAQTAIAFHRARLYDELRTEAVTDPLTRLYNRRYLLDRLHEEQSRAQRNSHPLAVLMLDIDRFKEVNDRHGHDAGDRVLIELASLLRRTMRAEDLVARYGGEEFCLLVPEVGPADGFRLAERLRRIVAEHAISSDIAVPRVTVSVGIAFLAQSDTDTEVVTRADLAMYRAKSSGGDRVCVACPADINLPESPAGSQAVG